MLSAQSLSIQKADQSSHHIIAISSIAASFPFGVIHPRNCICSFSINCSRFSSDQKFNSSRSFCVLGLYFFSIAILRSFQRIASFLLCCFVSLLAASSEKYWISLNGQSKYCQISFSWLCKILFHSLSFPTIHHVISILKGTFSRGSGISSMVCSKLLAILFAILWTVSVHVLSLCFLFAKIASRRGRFVFWELVLCLSVLVFLCGVSIVEKCILKSMALLYVMVLLYINDGGMV